MGRHGHADMGMVHGADMVGEAGYPARGGRGTVSVLNNLPTWNLACLQVLEALRKVAGDLGMGGASKREQIRAGVFRPGHLPPTRTLAEQADIELEEARQREEVSLLFMGPRCFLQCVLRLLCGVQAEAELVRVGEV